MTESEV